jgi:hypothetical protein
VSAFIDAAIPSLTVNLASLHTSLGGSTRAI